MNAFADDLAVWQSGRDIPKLVEDVQWAADTVSGWCKEWLMQISVNKCSVSLFSLSAKHARESGGQSGSESAGSPQGDQAPGLHELGMAKTAASCIVSVTCGIRSTVRD